MTKPTTPEKMSETLTEELSPQTVVAHTQTLGSAPVLQYREEEDEQDDMPLLYFDWEVDNSAMFVERWETKDAQISELNPAFNRPPTAQHLYALLLEYFARDIDGASVVGQACIQCDSSIAYGFVYGRMMSFESRPWVSTIIEGALSGSAKLANLFVSTTVHKLKPVKLECKLF